MANKLVISFISVILLGNCVANKENQINAQSNQLNEEQQYLIDIAFGNEFGTPYQKIRKWSGEIKIFLPETQYTELNEELTKIIRELKSIYLDLKISPVQNELDANYILYLGDKDSFVKNYEPSAAALVANNYGLFWINWNENFEIYKGSMYVDVVRTTEMNCQKHLLREELTQSLGLMNDTSQYPESIFYQAWTCTTTYTEMDKKVLYYFLNPKIKAGMTKNQVINILKNR